MFPNVRHILRLLFLQQQHTYKQIDGYEAHECRKVGKKAREITSLGKSAQTDLLKVCTWESESEYAAG
jgi:hypothetical protein